MDISISVSPSALAPAAPMPSSVQRLPFTVRPARDERDLAAIVALRHEAFGRHWPETLRSMEGIEAADRCPSSLVLLAECRDDGRILGTLRLLHNTQRPLLLEGSIGLPQQLRGRHLVEAARLAITPGAPAEVRWALFKASYYHCLDAGVHTMLVTARHSLARIYASLQFKDLLEPDKTYAIKHSGGMPHRVMAFRIGAAEQLWQSHPLRAFMADTLHPDISW
jgi:hypothetical protein